MKRTRIQVFQILLGLKILFSTPFLFSEIGIVEKAQEFTLKQDREAVYQLAHDSSQSKNLTIADWNSINRLLEMFYTEEGQSRYSSALSIMGSNPKLAHSRFSEALALEKGHQKVIQGLAATEILMGQCETAENRLNQHIQKNSYDGNAYIFLAMAFLCLSKVNEAKELVNQLDQKKILASDERLLELKVRINLPDGEKTILNDLRSKLQNIKKPQFPATLHLLEYKMTPSMDTQMSLAEQYVQICKLYTAKSHRSPPLNPLYCSELPLVEKELAVLKEGVLNSDAE
ncbi:MAG: hypothetical protein R2827_04035 [Bdellovibrionales bacterium]